MSCSTKASRSAGASVSSTTCSASPHGVRQQRFLLRIRVCLHAHDWVGHVDAQRLLAPGLPRLQHVQAHRRDDRGQPPAQVLDLARVGAAQPERGFLDGVVGLAQGAEHPVRNRAQVSLVLLEAFRQPGTFVHRSRPWSTLPLLMTGVRHRM